MRILCGVIVVCGVFGVLAGCIPTSFEARAPWRHEAEQKCLTSGEVRESPSVVLIKPIDGPGMCGADFPLKVSALGENAAPADALSYADELRPPGAVPGGAQFPPSQTYRQPPAIAAQPLPPAGNGAYSPPAAGRGYAGNGGTAPQSLTPDSGQFDSRMQAAYRPPSRNGQPSQQYDFGPDGDSRDPLLARQRIGEDGSYLAAPGEPARTYEGAQEPRGGYDPATSAPLMPPSSPGTVPMSAPRGPVRAVAAVSPPATLACPIVSALDRWIVDAVQPAAQRWFNSAVVEIKQISAYSCRGMNGQPGAHISEHAFGNALDIAAFILADGRKVTVEQGWRGTAEEQGFLHDVQLAACDQFTTVLAPGSNVYHYNHIHVDLMRRASGRRICQPRAVPGEEVAARVRGRNGPMVAQGSGGYGRQTGYGDASGARGERIGRDNDPFAWRGPNRGGADTTGSISSKDEKALRRVIDDEEFLGDDGDPDEHTAAPRIAAPQTTASRPPARPRMPAVDVNRIQ